MIKRILCLGTIIALGAIAAVGCNKGSGSYTPKTVKEAKVDEIKPDQGKELLPIKVGNQWTYNVESRQNIAGQASNKTDTLTLTIVDVQPVANGQRVILQSALNGENTDKQAWIVDDRGIFQEWIKNSNSKYNPPQPMVMFPLKSGANYVWKGSGPTVVGPVGTQEYKGTLLPTQFVDTDMGQFSAICAESDGSFTVNKVKGQSKLTLYWAKGVGLVRYKQETVFMTPDGGAVQGLQLIKLKNFTVK